MAVSPILDGVRRREKGKNSSSSFSAIEERKNELIPFSLLPGCPANPEYQLWMPIRAAS
jgi:hypothetical protein